MTVTYYSYTAEKNRIDKTGALTQLGSASGVPVDAVNVVHPAVLIEASVPFGANYAYIDTFSSYYWITEVTCDTGNQTVLTMTRDAAMTFKDQIFECQCVCERSTYRYNGFINDPRYPTLQRQKVEVQKIFDLPNTDTEVMAYIE